MAHQELINERKKYFFVTRLSSKLQNDSLILYRCKNGCKNGCKTDVKTNITLLLYIVFSAIFSKKSLVSPTSLL